MSDDDAVRDDLPTLGRHPDSDPLALDRGTAERLLAGTLDPADAPRAYAAAAEVLAAAAAPPRPDELAGEAEAVAGFRARRPAGVPVRARRRAARLAVISAVVIGLLSVGGAGFATGVLPRTGQWLGQTVGSVIGSNPAGAPPRTEPRSSTSTLLRGGPAPGTTPGSVQSPSSGAVPGSTASAEGLCRAWQAGKGRKAGAAALQDLAAAAGGSGNVAAYCRAVQEGRGDEGGSQNQGNGQGNGRGQGSDPNTPAASDRNGQSGGRS